MAVKTQKVTGPKPVGNNKKKKVCFRTINNLFHPKTINYSYRHLNSFDPTPGIRTDDGMWNTKGHKNRIVNVSQKELSIFKNVFGIKKE